MARTINSELRNAIDHDGSYNMSVYADVYPTRIFHNSIGSNFPIPGADAAGFLDSPVIQEVHFSPEDGNLITFYIQVSAGMEELWYATEGSSTVVQSEYSNPTISGGVTKPGVTDDIMWFGQGGPEVFGVTIDWEEIALFGDAPFSAWRTYIISDSDTTVEAVHGISGLEAVAIAYNEGGFRPYYINDANIYRSTVRFMFPIMIEPDYPAEGETAPIPKTPRQLATHSGVTKLGNKVFVYMSNESTGMIEGIYYDLDNNMWSDIYTALPTDLQTSKCEFRLSNVYTRNNTIYMCGQFNRTDNITGSQPYSLLLSSTDGKTFCIGRPTLVSNLGYRFLAQVKADTKELYLANCNRICTSDLTWFFNGDDDDVPHTTISAEDILGFYDSDLAKARLELRAGLEEYFDHPQVAHNARVTIYAGMITYEDQDYTYVRYGTYIIDSIPYGIGVGRRETTLNMTNEAMWSLTGLNMPFYAEILGKSTAFDPLLKESTLLTAAGNGSKEQIVWSLDFWNHEPYENTSEGITGISMGSEGGVGYIQAPVNHHYGIITSKEINEILALSENPLITHNGIRVQVWGWSHVMTAGQTNDVIHLVLRVVDRYGNEQDIVSTDTVRWENSYPDVQSGSEPITIIMESVDFDPVDGYDFHIGDKISKVGVSFQSANITWFNIARVNFMQGVSVFVPLWGADTPWEVVGNDYWRVPGDGKPFIMLAARPYNAFNFSLHSFFGYTRSNTLPYHGVYMGLVGLAEDAKNYICARLDLNTSSQHVQLVKCRDGQETILRSQSTPTEWTWPHLRFDHRNGYFEVYRYYFDTERYEKVLEYEWKESDGYMFTSTTASMRCGIYGYKESPTARTLGFYDNGDETTENAEAIPFDSAYDTQGWPTSGRVRIGDDIFNYNGRISYLSNVKRGPYQYRASGLYGSLYGLECRDFDWQGISSELTGRIIALNSGANFIGSGVDWQIPDLYNRARYYSANPQIGLIKHALANKVWVTDGLMLPHKPNQRVYKGPGTKHTEGEMAVFYREYESIICRDFMGAGGSDDTTIKDMIKSVCGLAGAKMQFSGDILYSSLSLDEGVPEVVATIPYSEGFDITFDVASFGIGDEISVELNARIVPDNLDLKSFFDDDTSFRISVTQPENGLYEFAVWGVPSGFDHERSVHYSTSNNQKFRITCLGDAVSLYQNGRWIDTFVTETIEYQNDLVLTLVAYNNSMELSNVNVSDLCDWREAIYIDLETDGRSALGSVIQQRPIEMIAKPDGSIDFWYDKTRDTLDGKRIPRDHGYIYSVPTDGASDAIIYGAKDVVTLQNPDFAKELGFATKVMRMPDLGIGAVRASKKLLDKMLESYHQEQFSIRPDLALEIGDIYHTHYKAVGTEREECRYTIIESQSIELRSSGNKINSSMQIRGRDVHPAMIGSHASTYMIGQ